MQTEGAACYVEDAQAEGMQGRILQGERQNQMWVSKSSLVTH